ncbi:MAG: hypothetical protein M3120_11395, partial [Pseudomonadota bacterium]|nr:hypothetical protein [Pseudomonadota bacterium]
NLNTAKEEERCFFALRNCSSIARLAQSRPDRREKCTGTLSRTVRRNVGPDELRLAVARHAWAREDSCLKTPEFSTLLPKMRFS